MKAIKYSCYGAPSVLKLEDSEKPQPKDNEVLVKIKAASVTRADTMMRQGSPYLGRLMLGLSRPKYSGMGTGFAGEIEAIGSGVTKFNVGDAVFGESIFGSGTNAEYVCVPETGTLLKKPESLSFEQACTLCDGPITSLNFLRDVGQLKANQHVLIVGASGSLGTAAVQLAKQMGATVSAVCSTVNIELVKSLGADVVIDYSVENFSDNGEQYDLIFDTVGKHSFFSSKNSLKKNGVYLSPVFGVGHLLQMMMTTIIGNKKAKFSATGLRPAEEIQEMMAELKNMFEAKKIQSVIDRCYPLAEAANAHAYIDKGHKKGNVVLVM